MKQVSLDHPSAEQLAAFGLGRLNELESATIEEHLSACETCCQIVDEVAPDSFVHQLKASPQAAASNSGTLSASGVGKDAANGSSLTTNHAPVAEAATLGMDEQTPLVSGANTATEPASPIALHHIPAELANHPRYGIQELLGTGGMGAVYKAEHRLMRRTVALKVINPKFIQTKQAVERFRREVEAAARLHHPNIVTAHDAEQAGDLHYLVMEYVPGTDLGKVLEERGPLPVAEACEYIRQAALGLQHAHENGMVHRDIKPQNLMVSGVDEAARFVGSSGRSEPLRLRTVKILDFGLASLTTEAVSQDSIGGPATLDSQKSGLTQAGSLMGTPDYMAPEQGRDAHTADIRSDIYSLGCTLYVLLTGKVPFPGGTAIDKVIAHSTLEPQPIGELRKDVPAALVKVLDTMMAKDPAGRYQTPAEVAAAVAPLSRLGAEGKGRFRRPRPLVAAAVAAVFAGIALVAGVVFYIVTDNGTIEIRTDDENIKIRAEQNGKLVKVLDPKSKQTWVLNTGEWTLKLGTPAHGFEIAPADPFTLKRGGHQVVTIRRVKFPEIAGQRWPEFEPGWTQLFNGKDLTGWKTHPDQPGPWEVKNRAITCSGPTSHLFSDRADYWNFHLRVEAKLNTEGDSGIYFRGEPGKLVTGSVASVPRGYEAQILADPKRFNSGTLEWGMPLAAVKDKLHQPDEWFTMEIIADGKWISVLVNGKPAATVEDTPSRGRPGPIALQHLFFKNAKFFRNTSVHFRKIEIKELSATVAAPASAIASKPRLLREIDNGSRVHALAYSPDGKTLIATGDALKVFDLRNGEELYRHEIPSPVTAPLSLAGDTVAFVHKGRIVVVDLINRKRIHDIDIQSKSSYSFSVAVSPDAKTVVYKADGGMRFHDLTTGKTDTGPDLGKGFFSGLRFTPDGRYLIGFGHKGGAAQVDHVTILDVKTRKIVDTRKSSFLAGTALSKDGKRLVAAGLSPRDETAAFYVFDVSEGKLRETRLESNLPGFVSSLSLSQDGGYLGLGLSNGAAQIWDLAQTQLAASWIPHRSAAELFTPVALAPDAKSMATAGDNKIKIWDLTPEPDAAPPKPVTTSKPRLIREIDNPSQVHALAYSTDGKTLITAGGALRVLDPRNGEELYRHEIPSN